MKKFVGLLLILLFSVQVAYAQFSPAPVTGDTLTGTVGPAHGGTGDTTAPSAGQVPVGNAGGTAYAAKTISGDATMSTTGALSLKNTGPGATSATNANITIDAQGRVTGVTSGVASAPASATYTTTADETGTLANSRQWIAGTATSVNTGTVGKIKIDNTGVTSNVAGTGISVSGATGAVTVTNTGVTSNVAGTGISVSGATGAVTVANTGVTSAVAGSGIAVSGATGAVTFSVNGSVNALTAGNLQQVVPESSASSTGTQAPYPFCGYPSVTSNLHSVSIGTLGLGLCAHTDGYVYACEYSNNKIAKLSSNNTLTEYTVTTAASHPYGICSSNNGAVYFTENTGNNIGKMTPSGTFTEYAIPTAASGAKDICFDGSAFIYFAESLTGKIGKMTLAGSFVEFAVPSGNPVGICIGTDGSVYGTEQGVNKIFKMTPAGAFTEYTVPTAVSQPVGICATADGRLAIAESSANKVAFMTTAGAFTEYATPTGASGPWRLCSGPDKSIYIAYDALGKIGKLTLSGTFTEITHGGTGSDNIATAPNGDIAFTDFNNSLEFLDAQFNLPAFSLPGQHAGSSALVGGTKTITTGACTASSLIFLQDTTSGSLTNVGILTAVAGSGSFVVTSTVAIDTSTFNWMIVNPAP